MNEYSCIQSTKMRRSNADGGQKTKYGAYLESLEREFELLWIMSFSPEIISRELVFIVFFDTSILLCAVYPLD